ncbi:MAG: phosphatase PAP2 family protein [Arachnia sp.]
MANDAKNLKGRAKVIAEEALDVVEDKVPVPIRPHLAILVPVIIGAFLMGLFTWGASEIYEAVTDNDELALLDQPVLEAMVDSRTGWLNTLIGAYTHVGGPIASPIIATIAVIIMCRVWRSWLPLTLMLSAALGSLAVTFVGKDLIGRLRPPHEFAIAPFESSPAFPSGHALNAVVVGGIIAYLLYRHCETRRARIIIIVLAIFYALTMGASRVYLGHHWMTDVMTGWLLGGAWLAVIITTHIVVAAVLNRRDGSRDITPADADSPDPAS